MNGPFERAIATLANYSGRDADLAAPVANALPVSGAAVSTLGEFLGSETVAASDAQIARIDEVQFDLGEGPCWDALRSRLPVLEPSLSVGGPTRWPMFTEALREQDVGAIFAFPLVVGSLRVGALDLYRRAPGALLPEHVDQAKHLAMLLSRQVLRRALRLADRSSSATTDRHSRRLIHQATGFVIAQLGVSAADAALLIQGQAFAESRLMQDVARDIVEYRLGFSIDGQGIDS